MSRREKSGRRTKYRGVRDLGGGEFLIRAYFRDPKTGRERQKERLVRARGVEQAFEQKRALEEELLVELDPGSWDHGHQRPEPPRVTPVHRGPTASPRGGRTPGAVGGSIGRSSSGGLTVGDAARAWLKRRLEEQRKDGRPRLMPNTRERYEAAVNRVIVPMLGDWELQRLTREDVTRWRDHLAKQYASATVNGYLGVLRALLADHDHDAAAKTRALEEDDTRITEDEPNLLDNERDLARFLGVMQSDFPQHFALVGVLVTTGMRIGTARALKREDFDPERGVIVARRRISAGEIVEGVKRRRTAKDTVPLVDWVWAAVETEWSHHNRKQVESGLAFPAANGGLRSGSCLNDAMAEVRTSLNLPRLTPHGLRRTAAVMYRRVASSAVSMSVLGHLTEQMHRHYAVVSTSEKQVAAAQAFAKISELDDEADGNGGARLQNRGPNRGPTADRG